MSANENSNRWITLDCDDDVKPFNGVHVFLMVSENPKTKDKYHTEVLCSYFDGEIKPVFQEKHLRDIAKLESNGFMTSQLVAWKFKI